MVPPTLQTIPCVKSMGNQIGVFLVVIVTRRQDYPFFDGKTWTFEEPVNLFW